MKTGRILGLFVLLTLTAFSSFAQEFTLTTTNANITSSRALIDLPGLSGNANAIIVATPLEGAKTLNPHPIGAWYYHDKWNIFNSDDAPLIPGLKYKVQVFLKPGANQFLHIITEENLGDEGSYLDHPALNNNPNAQVKILQNHAPDVRSSHVNQFEAKVAYNSASGKWYIANVNERLPRPNTDYNVVISSGGTGDSEDEPPPPPPWLSSANTTPMKVQPPANPAAVPPAVAQTTTQTTSQTPCRKETADQTVGKWGLQKKDDLAVADRTFPKAQYKMVLLKAQKVIELFKAANPEFKGIQASAQRGIRGNSYFPEGALPFRVDVGYTSYLCLGMDIGIVEKRGKIILHSGYGSTTVHFNSLRNVLDSVQEGKPLLTTEGEEIFQFEKQLGEFKGFTMIQPLVRDLENHEAVIITPDNRLPYKRVTREQFLRARIRNYQAQGGFASEIAGLTTAIGNMSPAERQAAAIVRDLSATPGRVKLFATEAAGGRHLVTIDKSFFDPKLPRDAIQLITIHWNWNDKDTPKVEAIRQFKQNFDFAALRQMLGK